MSDKKLRVALINDSWYPMIDGVVTTVDGYAKNMGEYADVTVIAPNSKKGYVDQTDYPLLKSKAVKMPFLDYHCAIPLFDRKFMKLLKEKEFDIIHIHAPFPMGVLGVREAKRRGIPVVATMHAQFKYDFKRATKSDFIAGRMTAVLLRLYNKCDEVWAVNEGTQDLLKDYGFLKPSYVMRAGTEMLPQDKAAARKEVYEMFHIDESLPMFLSVGRITLFKNILFTVDSLKVLKEKGIPFKMIFVGGGVDTDKLKARIKKQGLEEDVILTGKIPDNVLLSQIYAAATLTLFPSHYDTDGLIKYESASQGTPTVLVEGTLAATGLEDKRTGYIGQNSVEGFADKIIEILNDQETYKQVCENVRDELYRTWPQRVQEAYERYLYVIEQYKEKNEKKVK
ncbi:MAG: glycosyltransferase [Methanimicrococcus sp.]|nr:glycosyltransferase [Methanimicrococcus sp.]